MTQRQVIAFKLVSGEYGYLANFYRKIILVDGIKFRSGEHLYQYKKFKFLQDIGEPVTEEMLQAIIDAKTPKDVKALGHMKLNNIEEWDKVKVDAMMDVLREKFKYERFRQKLLDTGDAILIESSYYDRFWGDGGYKRNGLNMLGKCLMRIRDELSDSEEQIS